MLCHLKMLTALKNAQIIHEMHEYSERLKKPLLDLKKFL